MIDTVVPFLLAGGRPGWTPSEPAPRAVASAPKPRRKGRPPSLEPGRTYFSRSAQAPVTAIRYVPGWGRWLCRNTDGRESFFRAGDLVST